MGLDGATFGGSTAITRLEQAVALVRALRMDAQARALAGRDVKSGVVVLSDNGQIPSSLRGYVQIAIDKGFLEVYPAEIK